MNTADAIKQTVALVRMHDRVGTRTRRHRVPRAKYPKTVEFAYATALVGTTKVQRDVLQPILDLLPNILPSKDDVRHDEVRADAGESKAVRDAIALARARMGHTINTNKLEALAQTYAMRTERFNAGQIRAQAKAALGVEIATADVGLRDKLESFVHENVSLIESLHERTFDDIEKDVLRAVSSGTRHEDVAANLIDRLGISDRHARLIARDQVGKLNSRLTTSRHQELGVERFKWLTVGDERVRDGHTELEEQSEDEPFSYDDPPEDPDTGEAALPGEPILCRCVADPVFDDILDSIDDDEDGDSGSSDSESGDEDSGESDAGDDDQAE